MRWSIPPRRLRPLQGSRPMSRTMVRSVAAALVLFTLALPLAAQPESGQAPGLSLLSLIWNRIAAHAVALFITPTTGGCSTGDPNGHATDGRSGFDPNG
jgi:predicted permease